MRSVWRGWMLLMLALAVESAWIGSRAWAQMPTTVVQDTVYRADGTVAGGSVVVTWNAFTTANGVAVPAGSTTANIGVNGVVQISLAPNAGSTPMGSYYTAVFHLNDGTTSREYWVVPVAVPGGGPAKLAAIRNQVLPASVAMQTVSKQYVDNAIAQAQIGGIPLDQSPYVMKAGDTMTGPLVLPGDPATPNQASDKNYVDSNVAQLTAGLAGKVSLLPSTSQTVTQPAGTKLDVNRLNGTLYSGQFGNASTSSVTAALASPECASGCRIVVEPTDQNAGTIAGLPQQTRVSDLRGGGDTENVTDPLTANGDASGLEVNTISGRAQTAYAQQFNGTLVSSALTVHETAVTGGSNLDPTNVETTPYFKNTFSATQIFGSYATQGQHVTQTSMTECFAVGDCLAGSQVIRTSGGYRDPSDEGAHPMDLQVTEDGRVFEATCASGCTTGSTSMQLNTTAAGGTQGDGRFLIDRNPAKDISTGSLVGGDDEGPFAGANFSGTNFPVSVFLATAVAATSQPRNMAPGTVTLPIATSGVPNGFATSTAALPATTGIACVADVNGPSLARFPDFETAPYTVVDGTHVQLTLNKPHAAGAAIAVGGLCGYGLEQTVDSFYQQREVFPVVGSVSATRLLYADGGNPIVGRINNPDASGYANIQLPVASATRSGNVVTITLANALVQDVNGLTMTVSGIADASYNGTYQVTTTSLYTLTYSNVGPDSTSSGGTVSMVTGGYTLYPMAEVLSVADTATGGWKLAPNTVPWATGDAVEEPHYYLTLTYPDSEIIAQRMPRPQFAIQRPGKIFADSLGPGMAGWDIVNMTPQTSYYGGGGTHYAPDAAYMAEGVWDKTFDVTAGEHAVINIRCNLTGCGRWNSGYNILQMQSPTYTDTFEYQPQANTATIRMAGTPYTFSHDAFHAGVANIDQLNVTKLNGSVPAYDITSGTLDPARLPIFGPSGTTHAPGAVPDPGATAGSTRYLREDGTWAVPAGGNGGSTGGGASSVGAAGALQASNGAGGLADSGCTGTSGSISCNTFTTNAIVPSGGQYVYISKTGAGVSSSNPGFMFDVSNQIWGGSFGTGGSFQIQGDPTTSTSGASIFFGGSARGDSKKSATTINFNNSAVVVVDGDLAGHNAGYVYLGTGRAAGSNSGVPARLTVGTSDGFQVNDSGNVTAVSYHETLSTPASSSAACNAGDFTDDANYHYVCVATNTWKRVALSSF